MFGKPLAYIVKIKDIREIPGADRIELATVMDYTVVVKKNEYKPNDLALYIEIDSILPDGLSPELSDRLVKLTQLDGEYSTWTQEQVNSEVNKIMAQHKYPYFEFLRAKKFKIKSMKLGKFGVISQGILFKPESLTPDAVPEGAVSIPAWKICLGADLTKELGITEAVQDEEEAGVKANKDNFITKYLMRYKWFRNWRKRHNVSEIWDPTNPGKSDEENVQKVYTEMYEKYKDRVWVKTEKLEGQNITVFSENTEPGILAKIFHIKKPNKRIGVCSRTRELNKTGSGKPFWDTVLRHKLDDKIKKIPGEWFCRGEHVGPGIQKNIYKLKETDIIFFDFYKKVYYENTDNRKTLFRWQKLNFDESILFAKTWDLKFVPVLDTEYKLPAGMVNDKGVFISGADIMLQESDGNTCFGNNLNHKREGFVLRLKDDYTVSFKVKNPNYSL